MGKDSRIYRIAEGLQAHLDHLGDGHNYRIKVMDEQLPLNFTAAYIVSQKRTFEHWLFNMRYAEVVEDYQGSFQVRSYNPQLITQGQLQQIVESTEPIITQPDTSTAQIPEMLARQEP